MDQTGLNWNLSRRITVIPGAWCARLILGLMFATLSGFAAGSETPAPADPLRKAAEYRMQYARLGAAAAVVGDFIYIFGGSGGRDAIHQAERLNVRTGVTELLPPRFRARRLHNVVEHDGRFLIFGGQGYQLPGRVLDDVIELYDPATQTVTEIGKMPRPRTMAGAVIVDREVYFIGGGIYQNQSSYGQTNRVEIYHLDTGVWRQGPPMPTSRESPAVAVGQFVLVAGGYSQRNKREEVELFVPAEQVWKKLPALSRPIGGHSAAHLGRWLFLFGDYDESDMVLAYDLSTRRTTRLKPGFADVSFSTAVSHGDHIYVIGGQAHDSGYAGGGRNLNFALAGGSERDLIQVFALQP
jgi:hypothetical protein